VSAPTLVVRREFPLCGSGRRSVHHDFAEIPVVRCLDCAFLFSGRTMAPDVLERYYGETFGSERHLQGQRVNARVNLMVLRRLLDLRTISSLLDVGTGYGLLLPALRDRYGIDVHGVELSERESARARDRLGLDVRTRPLAKAGFEPDSFDAVISLEVIEHVLQPVAFVRELATYVRPGGIVVVGTDNFESADARALGERLPKWIPHTHVSHFGPVTLRRCLTEAGLNVEGEVSYTPWDLYARRLAPRRVQAEYDLERVLREEMGGRFRLFRLRLVVNPIWAAVTLRRDLGGAMMFALARRA
jgi:2-polyprenyl-3-methyl-5-hydroxy-6-metoxy-1,4-benzoquinol methylase